YQQSSTLPKPVYSVKKEQPKNCANYSYFGARYYDSDLSVWLSVDPMSDKYPSTSAYMYVLGNPLILIDPNGMSASNPDWVETTDDEGNKTIVWDDKVTSADDSDLKEGDKYMGKEGYAIDENTGEALHYKPDKSIESFTQVLPQANHVEYDDGSSVTFKASNPSISSKNRTGLIWDERDIAVWNEVGGSNSPIGVYIRNMIKTGNFEMLSAERYWNTYGNTLGTLLFFQQIFDCMSLVAGAPIIKGYNPTSSSRYYYYNPSGSSPTYYTTTPRPSFQQWIHNNGYKYRGRTNNFFKDAWRDYKSIHGK
ncbi:MAG: hypothetical protein JXR90_15135, partial [Spirochaetes bacterium]|nr:hypothetical protein [Spirochaetota bacterium]